MPDSWNGSNVVVSGLALSLQMGSRRTFAHPIAQRRLSVPRGDRRCGRNGVGSRHTPALMDRDFCSFLCVAPHLMRGLAFLRSVRRREEPQKVSQAPCQARGDERLLGLAVRAT